MTGRDDAVRPCDARPKTRAQTIRELNDALRRGGGGGGGGRLFLTSGVMHLRDGAVADIVQAVRRYDRFDDGNDPYGEHDFGAFDHAGTSLFWKIDYYDRDLTVGSPDPADPSVTTRVLTIMLAEEW